MSMFNYRKLFLAVLGLLVSVALLAPPAIGDDKGGGGSGGSGSGGSGGGTDDKGGSGGGGADDKGRIDDRGGFKFYGTVQALAGSNAASQIGGRTVRFAPGVSAELAVGACAEVEGALQSDGSILVSAIHAESSQKCGSGMAPLSFVGGLKQMPDSGSRGDWQIATRTVHVSASTQMRQEHGPFVKGACVEVKGAVNSDDSISATEVEIKSSSGGCTEAEKPEAAELKFFGIAQALSSGASGDDWLVGGRRLHITPETHRSGSRPAALGACVEVEAHMERDGTATATKISTESSACSQGVKNTEQPKFVGRVQGVPAGGTGNWQVGNRVVRVTSSTEIEHERAQVSANTCVEVKGDIQDDSTILARKIEVEDSGRCGQSLDGRFEHLGIVETQVADNGPGEWRIGGHKVRIFSNTIMETEHGQVVPGACVEVQGNLLPDDSVMAVKLEVHSSSGTCLARHSILNAASFSDVAVSPGMIVSIFGLNLGPSTDRALEVRDDRLTSRVGNVRVMFDGVPAPVIFVSAGQVNVVVPYSVSGRKETEVQVENNGAWSNAVKMPVVAAAPALFTVAQSGNGQGAILNHDQSGSLTLNDRSNAAPRGSYISLYATGEGQTEPAGDDGRINKGSVLPRPALPVSVFIDGKRIDDRNVVYAGAAPLAVAGLLQVDLKMPDDAPIGPNVPIVLAVGDRRSRDSVTVAIR